MLSLRDENFKLLMTEAGDRGITVQELIRAVIIPDWAKANTLVRPVATQDKIRPYSPTNGREPIIQSMGKLRT
jgi:hypothetical protein